MTPDQYRIAITVSKVFGIGVNDLKRKSRLRKWCEPRMVLMVCSKLGLGLTWQESAMGLNHATAIHARSVVRDIYVTDGEFRERMDRVAELFEGDLMGRIFSDQCKYEPLKIKE